jgi:hypothetical protein
MIAGKVVCYAIGLPWVSHKFHTEFTLVSCTKQLIGVTIVGNLLDGGDYGTGINYCMDVAEGSLPTGYSQT